MDPISRNTLPRAAGCVLAAICAAGSGLALSEGPGPDETGQVLLSDIFDAPESPWRPIRLSGDGRAGRVRTEGGKLLDASPGPDGISAAWHPTPSLGKPRTT